ncbi:hypothetical protein CI109_102151 [Kwoniella shandongensis]|uniref:Uncharacterized protein n=1 Tax=Kwoniella shandongensis TaxID=1734106 RepID=A0A5M6C3A1_9TREE|nr:uncharacterized protein CI109_003690 [Kwoniella shandongensis]KAA5528035.1 hypothetical protein CI109_003690 [Kwoniella shandongensis]
MTSSVSAQPNQSTTDEENALPPPPTYVPSQPQILVVPLPDSASFFWGRTVQGEVYVKGLGEGRGKKIGVVKSLSIQLYLTNHLPNHPSIPLHIFPLQTLYPPQRNIDTSSSSSSSTPAPVDPTAPFPSSQRFSIPLPSSLELPSTTPSVAVQYPVPGTLNLTAYDKGEVRWGIRVELVLPSGQKVVEDMRIEGTPQDVGCSSLSPAFGRVNGEGAPPPPQEVEEKVEKDGGVARLLVDQATPRLGELLRLGVEIKPQEKRKKTGVAGLSSQPDPAETLRPLRRVRVELFRRVTIHSDTSEASSSSTSDSEDSLSSSEYLTLLHASGKSLRYPGSGRNHPPVRVLFTVPTAQLGAVAEQTWGEINMTTVYHSVSFFLRVTIGFGIEAGRDWTIQREIVIRPRLWREPTEVVIERGLEPAPGSGGVEMVVDGSGVGAVDGELATERYYKSDEEMAREAYRHKGRDVVGQSGTFRAGESAGRADDLPPPFDGATPNGETSAAGPSTSASGLPTFLESEEQMRAGEAPLPTELVRSERLVPVAFEEQIDGDGEGFDRSTWVGRRGSLGGELGTWVEYDGYETFSVAPPSMSASFGVGGSMDPPQEGDIEGASVVGGMVARLGMGLEGGRGMEGLELMEHLGLGEGTRVVDLQDDLPPGIDEPSLPALPSFDQSHSSPHQPGYHHPPAFGAPPPHPHPHTHTTTPPAHDPPSFDASQAASAVGGVAASSLRAGARRPSRHAADEGVGVGVVAHGEAPPGYERGGLPPYS